MSDQIQAVATTAVKRPGRWRRFLSGIGILCLILAVVGTPLSTLSWWAKHSLLTTSNVVTEFGPLVHDSRMQALIIEKASEQIWAQTQSAKIERQINKRINKMDIPDAAKKALKAKQSAIITDLETLLDDTVSTVVKSDQFASGWNSILAASHKDALKTFKSNAEIGTTAAPGVGVQVGPIATAVVNNLKNRGFIFADLLPTKFSYTIQVMDDRQVSLLRPVARFAESYTYKLIGAVAGLYLLGMLLVTRRWIKLSWAAIAVLVTMAAIAAVFLTVGGGVADLATGGNFGKAASLVIQTAVGPLWPVVGVVSGVAGVIWIVSTVVAVRKRKKLRQLSQIPLDASID